jgi:hypothetical protein
VRTDEYNRRLCIATAKSTGQLCRSPAVTGATVCIKHGAAKGTPARAKAERRNLTELVGPALMKLHDLVLDDGTPPAVLLAAIRETLDRTGYSEQYSWTLQELWPMLENALAAADQNLSPDERGRREAQQRLSVATASMDSDLLDKVTAKARKLRELEQFGHERSFVTTVDPDTGQSHGRYVTD